MYMSKEYRKAFREFFNMNVASIHIDETYDEETADEILFDADAAKEKMDIMLKKSENNTLFDELYILAAGKMLSVDREIGLCILLSYDYFSDFTNLWRAFENNIDIYEYYLLLKNKM